jgi:hypothetical protein
MKVDLKMEKALFFTEMVKFIKVNSVMMLKKDKDLSSALMDLCMSDNLKMVKEMVKEDSSGQMDKYMMDNG